MASTSFNEHALLSYLQLPDSHEPSPSGDPVSFLSKYILRLPQHLSVTFSSITSPKERTTIPAVRNRRLGWVKSSPNELSFESARRTWPVLWTGSERRGIEEGDEEKRWAESDFMQGTEKHVKKLGALLGQYEEEREVQRLRDIRRQRMAAEEFVPEEDSESEEDENAETAVESFEEQRKAFERQIHEMFIYGLLDQIDYDSVDFNDSLDRDIERELEERWFDDDD
ncbi:hypothetical protein E1B28_004189 [Marasmius oreades]|uniref:CCD97-like C-terminal domain-containing protein n=1 Tax=Marasmius oreades TaxID=181124 RepID=A0A9P8ACP3_9AGAR|nr:uncharacterized protein E1B28_004189 [Marasmius oreades]KAG7096779.1 hypothetical protein E1B28_004189 [Marasmius oreades]